MTVCLNRLHNLKIMETPFLNWLPDAADIARFKRDDILIVKPLVNSSSNTNPSFLGNSQLVSAQRNVHPLTKVLLPQKFDGLKKCGAPTRNPLSFLYNKNLLRWSRFSQISQALDCSSTLRTGNLLALEQFLFIGITVTCGGQTRRQGMCFGLH